VRIGQRNLITDVPGLLVGNAANESIKTGVTVLTANEPFIASVDVMGGAPGTRETDCLTPENLVNDVDALVLSGGSALGLDAASGVTDALLSQGKGFQVGPVRVPIVPAAIVFDLINGGDKSWAKNPYKELGSEAFANCDEQFALGSVGGGCGATTANLKGGLGSASVVLDNGVTVGALVVANPHGSVVVPGCENFWASPFEVGDEFGNRGVAAKFDPLAIPVSEKLEAFLERANTTIAIVATDLALDKAACKRFATAAQDGMARAIVPSHTAYDGDLVFGISTRERPCQDPITDIMMLGHAGSVCLSRAIARAVFHASRSSGDILPTWQERWG